MTEIPFFPLASFELSQRLKDKGKKLKDKGQRLKDKGQRLKDKGQRLIAEGYLELNIGED